MNTTSARLPEWVTVPMSVQLVPHGATYQYWWYQRYLAAYQDGLAARAHERSREQVHE